jgi:hypothetical protein
VISAGPPWWLYAAKTVDGGVMSSRRPTANSAGALRVVGDVDVRQRPEDLVDAVGVQRAVFGQFAVRLRVGHLHGPLDVREERHVR